MSSSQPEYANLEVELSQEVATIRLFNPRQRMARGGSRTTGDAHFELGQALGRLREDDGVRVVIITGSQDGEPLAMAGRPEDAELYKRSGVAEKRERLGDPFWKAFQGIRLTHQAIIEMEKPVIARVNGDAVGFAQSVMFACDLIVAWEDARVVDHHMGMAPTGLPFGVVPGDGGACFAPLYMSPAKAMEYLLLAKEYTAGELARAGIINYAVPMEKLDAVVDDLVARLLERSAYALALTKRVAKRQMAEHMNLTMDASNGYEWVNFLHHMSTGQDVRHLGRFDAK
jgi:enoyl-CoA hydratase